MRTCVGVWLCESSRAMDRNETHLTAETPTEGHARGSVRVRECPRAMDSNNETHPIAKKATEGQAHTGGHTAGNGDGGLALHPLDLVLVQSRHFEHERPVPQRFCSGNGQM